VFVGSLLERHGGHHCRVADGLQFHVADGVTLEFDNDQGSRSVERQQIDAPPAVIVIRVMVGAVFLSEGIQKFLFPESVGAGRFETIGFPAPEFVAALEDFVRGLFHSDGCRITNRVRRTVAGRERCYEYPRYFFSNASQDILQLLGCYLDALGIEWRMANDRNLSVAKRDSVALLDSFVGPKY
jgi:uncharacterized membrane protein YphA (DoxX/SURF4 family)